MKPYPASARPRPHQRSYWRVAILFAMALGPVHAHASIFQGEALDTLADVLAWAVLVIVPIVGIAAFWLVHILPEKIAEKKQHPQAKAIQTLCLLSLVFGGLLWPLAWLWAYSKPVFYKMAYGTDQVAHSHEDTPQPASDKDEAEELKQLRKRVAELESKRPGKSAAEGEKA
jgi:CBS domain containing-hemolysin-like protein